MKIIYQNKKAGFDYEILDKYTAGIILLGSEIKSIRAGHVNLKGSYVSVLGEKAILKGAHITRYAHDSSTSYDPFRDRQLLLNKAELHKIENSLNTQGVTVIPMAVGIEGKYAKLVIGVARGKKKHDKRHAIKQRETKREIDRAVRRHV